jgi:Uma2 family endonuclease
MVTNKLLTAEDVWNMEDDGCRHELIRGELLTMSPAGRPHGKLLTELARRIGNFLAEWPVGEAYTGDTGFILSRDPDVLLAPDLWVIRIERLPENPPEAGFEELTPDLVVEIISPSERPGQINRKVWEYLNAGVRLVWLIDPGERNVTIHAPNRQIEVVGLDGALDGGDVLPEFHLSLSELFR